MKLKTGFVSSVIDLPKGRKELLSHSQVKDNRLIKRVMLELLVHKHMSKSRLNLMLGVSVWRIEQFKVELERDGLIRRNPQRTLTSEFVTEKGEKYLGQECWVQCFHMNESVPEISRFLARHNCPALKIGVP